MEKKRYQIRATVPREYVNEIEKILGLPFDRAESNGLHGCWEISSSELPSTLESLREMGVTDVIIQELGIHFYIAIDREKVIDIIQEISSLTVGNLNKLDDPFSDGDVLSFVVKAENSDIVYNIIRKNKIERFIALQCFTISDEVYSNV